MEVIDVNATPVAAPPTNYAGFILRFAAYLIDRFVVGVIFFAAIVPVLAIFGISMYNSGQWKQFENMESGDEMNMGAIIAMVSAYTGLFVLAIVIYWLYYALMESSSRQATLGKMAVGIKVTDMNGNRINFMHATGRYFGKIISGAIFFIGYFMIIFTDKKQALHDIMAGTLVVRK